MYNTIFYLDNSIWWIIAANVVMFVVLISLFNFIKGGPEGVYQYLSWLSIPTLNSALMQLNEYSHGFTSWLQFEGNNL